MPSTGLLLVALLPLQAWPAEGQHSGPRAVWSDNGEVRGAPVVWPSTSPSSIGDTIASPGWDATRSLAVSEPAVLTLSDVRGDPDAHVGSVVRWTVQNLGLQRADSLRSDMAPGQLYLLVRDPGGEAGLVYITVPDPLLAFAAAIGPLERFEVVGRVIAGRSAPTGHPILELLELREMR